VEDEPQSARIVSRVLEISGYRCVVAADALEAREHLRKEEFSLVVCDVALPGESGLDLARFIMQQNPEAAVIMISGLDDPKLINIALEIGTYGYVLKPLRPQQLLITIASALRQRALDIENRFRQRELEQVIANRSAKLLETRDELDREHQILQRAYAERDQLLAAIPSILIAVDADGRITRWNRAAAQVFGVEDSSMIGQPLREADLAWDAGKLLHDIASALQNAEITRLKDVPFRRPDGKEGVLCLNVAPFCQGQGFLLSGSEVTQ
jgi:putative two-component system response regulator